jgi:hypothetical protein
MRFFARFILSCRTYELEVLGKERKKRSQT